MRDRQSSLLSIAKNSRLILHSSHKQQAIAALLPGQLRQPSSAQPQRSHILATTSLKLIRLLPPTKVAGPPLHQLQIILLHADFLLL